MKKIMISLLMAAATLNAMAAISYTGVARLTLTSADNKSCSLVIGESEGLNAGLNNGYYAELNTEGKDVQMYVTYGSKNYDQFASNAATMQNLQLGIKTNASTTYTLTASSVSGSLKVKINGVIYNVTADLNEEITLPANSTLPATGDENKYLVQPYDAPAPQYETSLTTNAYGWATFSYNQDLAKPAGLTIYKGAFDGNSTLNLNAVDYVAAGEGVVVKGDANTTYYFNLGSGSDSFDGNDLKPTGAYAGMKADYDIFVLHDNMLNLLDAEGDFPVNKAFLPVAKSAGAPARISMRFGEATGVENVQAAEKAEKFVQDGQILIRRGEAVYNLQGQMVK